MLANRIACRRPKFGLWTLGLLFITSTFGIGQNKPIDHEMVRTNAVNVDLYLFDQSTYANSVLPAFRVFKDTDNVSLLIDLLKRARSAEAESSGDTLRLLSDFELYSSILEQFRNSGAKSSDYFVTWGAKKRSLVSIVNENVAPDAIRYFCLVKQGDHVVKENVSRTALIPYLYQHSNWILKLLTFESSQQLEPLELSFGDSTEILPHSFVQRFYDELFTIPSPSDAVQSQQYDSLLSLLRASLNNPKYTVALTVD